MTTQQATTDTQPRLWAVWSTTDPDHLIGTRRSEADADRCARTWGGRVEPLFGKDTR